MSLLSRVLVLSAVVASLGGCGSISRLPAAPVERGIPEASMLSLANARIFVDSRPERPPAEIARARAAQVSAARGGPHELPPIVITDDRGGSVQQYATRVLANRERRVVIDGDCESACTLWLMASGVCVTPRARLLFHAAVYAENGQRNTFATEWMYRRYPTGIRRLLDQRGGIYSGNLVVSYSDLRQVLSGC